MAVASGFCIVLIIGFLVSEKLQRKTLLRQLQSSNQFNNTDVTRRDQLIQAIKE